MGKSPSKKTISLDEVEAAAIKLVVKVTYEAIGGATVKELIKLSNRKSTLMMVMGMRGEGIFPERLIGTLSKEISQRAFCPVLLVPQKIQYNGFKNILYASNYDSVEKVLFGVFVYLITIIFLKHGLLINHEKLIMVSPYEKSSF